jgi:hypothetical protein
MNVSDSHLERALETAFRARASEIQESVPDVAALGAGYVPAAANRRRQRYATVVTAAAAAAVLFVLTMLATNTAKQQPTASEGVSPPSSTTTTLQQLRPEERVLVSGEVEGKVWRLVVAPTATGRQARLEGADMQGVFTYSFDKGGPQEPPSDPSAQLFSAIGPCCRLGGKTVVVAVLHPRVRELVVTPSGQRPITVEPVADDDPSSWHYAVAIVPPTKGAVSVITDDGQSHDIAVDGGWDFANIGG